MTYHKGGHSQRHLMSTTMIVIKILLLVSCPDPPFSAVLDVLHHQRVEER